MQHRDFQFIALFGASLALWTFAVLAVIRRPRLPGIIGVIGSAALLCGVICGAFLGHLGTMIALEIAGSSLLLFSSLTVVKRRYS